MSIAWKCKKCDYVNYRLTLQCKNCGGSKQSSMPTASPQPTDSEGQSEADCYAHRWELKCKSCKDTITWKADSYEDATDRIIKLGWRSSRFWGGMVCDKCSVSA